MTCLAIYTAQLVLRAVEGCLVMARLVTAKATFRVLLGGAPECVNELHGRRDLVVVALCRSHSIYMLFSGAVAAFASRGISGFGVRPIGVYGLGKLGCNLPVALLAGIGAYIVRRIARADRFPRNRRGSSRACLFLLARRRISKAGQEQRRNRNEE